MTRALPMSTATAEAPAQCCRVCQRGQACGDACISAARQCTKAPGCAGACRRRRARVMNEANQLLLKIRKACTTIGQDPSGRIVISFAVGGIDQHAHRDPGAAPLRQRVDQPPPEHAVLPQKRLEVNRPRRPADLLEHNLEESAILQTLDGVAVERDAVGLGRRATAAARQAARRFRCADRGSRWRLVDQMTTTARSRAQPSTATTTVRTRSIISIV